MPWSVADVGPAQDPERRAEGERSYLCTAYDYGARQLPLPPGAAGTAATGLEATAACTFLALAAPDPDDLRFFLSMHALLCFVSFVLIPLSSSLFSTSGR